MHRKSFLAGIILAVGCFIAMSVAMPSAAYAQKDPRVAKSMKDLIDATAKLGAPKVEGKEAVGGTDAPALYFGSTKINNNFTVVDQVAKDGGAGMTATLFVRSGDDFIRVATNVPKPDGSRAIGTKLDSKALDNIRKGEAFYGEVPLQGSQYITGYEPIKIGNNVIGIYYVGFKKQ